MIGVGSFRISEKARAYINQVLDSERLSYGPFTQKFERLFAAAHDSRYAVMTNSGTSCLQIALLALKEKYDWKDGDDVMFQMTIQGIDRELNIQEIPTIERHPLILTKLSNRIVNAFRFLWVLAAHIILNK